MVMKTPIDAILEAIAAVALLAQLPEDSVYVELWW